MSIPYISKSSAIQGKHRNDGESKAWFYSPDAVTMSPMHCRRRNKSVSIQQYLPANHRRCIAGTFRLNGNMLTIIRKPVLSRLLLLLPITVHSNLLSNVSWLLISDVSLGAYHETVTALQVSILGPTMVGPEEHIQN